MEESVRPSVARTAAIAGAKGGLGKTFLTANLAIALARLTEPATVVAADLDLSGSDLGSCLGVRHFDRSLNEFFKQELDHLEEALTTTEQENVRLLPCAFDSAHDIEVNSGGIHRLFNAFKQLDAQWIVMDLPSGFSEEAMDLFLSAEERILVLQPESLALQNTFLFLESVILRFLWREVEKESYFQHLKGTLRSLIKTQEHLVLRELLDGLRQHDQYAAYILAGLLEDLKIKLVVNMYRGGPEEAYLQSFHRLLFHKLQLRDNIAYLGTVRFDRSVRRSVQAREPFILRFSDSPVAQDVAGLASRLVSGTVQDLIPPLKLP